MTQHKQTRHVGVIGLAVMGANLSLNLARNGYAPAVYNRTASVTEAFLNDEARDTGILPTWSIEELIASLERPRRILMMVKAGPAVDSVIAEVTPFLDQGDILIDGGNSFFQDTARRSGELERRGLNYVGMGVSGGEEGALWGPSLMPGGPDEAYAELEPMLTAIAAKSDSGPCVTHIGPGASGHYVKMVHNGIEYGDMQLIAETYDVMRSGLGMSAPEIAGMFERWNTGKLESFLIEITAAVLSYVDKETNQPLVDVIADEAEQKGTGRWTSQNSFELGTPVPVINAAVIARSLSAMKAKRVEASKVLHGPDTNGAQPDIPGHDTVLKALENGLYFAKISSYAQGFAMMQEASDEYNWNLNLSEIARIWKAGCIIRARLLDPIMAAFDGTPPDNLMLDPDFTNAINGAQPDIRTVLRTALACGIPTPALSSALNYVDTYRQARLPANLIQGQRDFFGAHTYRRVDREGTFHTEWAELEPAPRVTTEPGDTAPWADGAGEGDRSREPATTPAGADERVLHPKEEDELTSDPDEKGERTAESTRKAEY